MSTTDQLFSPVTMGAIGEKGEEEGEEEGDCCLRQRTRYPETPSADHGSRNFF